MPELRRIDPSATTPGSGPQARLVDGVGALLVVGSLPPHGRDLDLLVADADVPALERRLTQGGLERWDDGHWVRVTEAATQVVDVAIASSWALPDATLTELFASAALIPAYAGLRAPAPAHALLILARRQIGIAGPPAPKHAERIAACEVADPACWTDAFARADAWRARAALQVLYAWHVGGQAPAHRRMRASVEAARREHTGPLRAAAAAAAAPLPRRRQRGAVVALSGVDGSGKSTQAEALARALEALGCEVAVVWSRITFDRELQWFGTVPKRLLGLLERARGTRAGPPEQARASEDAAAASLRARLPWVNWAWALIVAAVHARNQRRELRPHLRRGRVVVRDRYVLDAVVQLQSVYGRHGPVGLPAWILRWACPAPVAAFWLDADPEEAYRRKPEEYTADELAEHRRRYLVAHESIGAVRVDAARPPDDVAAELACAAWRQLAGVSGLFRSWSRSGRSQGC